MCPAIHRMTRVAITAKRTTKTMCRPFVRAQYPRFSNVVAIPADGFPIPAESKPLVAHLECGAVHTLQKVQRRRGLGQLVSEEVPRRLALAVVEVAGMSMGGQHLFEPQPGDDDMPERLEIDDTVGHRCLDVTGAEHRRCDADETLPGRFQLGGKLTRLATGRPGGGDRLFHRIGERGHAGAATLSHLAAQEVQALDTVCALVNGVEPVIAVMLFDVVFAGVAVATVHLDGEVVGLKAPL